MKIKLSAEMISTIGLYILGVCMFMFFFFEEYVYDKKLVIAVIFNIVFCYAALKNMPNKHKKSNVMAYEIICSITFIMLTVLNIKLYDGKFVFTFMLLGIVNIVPLAHLLITLDQEYKKITEA